MMKRAILLVAITLLSAGVWAQSSGHVTVAEADAIFQKVDNAIRDVLEMKQETKRIFGPSRLVTRAEVIARMDKLFESYKPHFQYTPRTPRLAPDVVKQFNSDAATQKSIEKLTRWGFLAPVGPVVTGPGDTLSIREFASAIGFFMSQTAALTYFADPKWLPNLQPPGAIGG